MWWAVKREDKAGPGTESESTSEEADESEAMGSPAQDPPLSPEIAVLSDPVGRLLWYTLTATFVVVTFSFLAPWGATERITFTDAKGKQTLAVGYVIPSSDFYLVVPKSDDQMFYVRTDNIVQRDLCSTAKSGRSLELSIVALVDGRTPLPTCD